MSKLIKAMVEAVNNRTPYSGGNTVVTIIGEETQVLFHGHLIAKISTEKLEMNYQGFPTTSTSERLRALVFNRTMGTTTLKVSHGKVYVTKPDGKYVFRNDEWFSIT